MIRIACLTMVLAAALAQAADEFQLAPAVECSPRRGLPNFLAKLNTKGAEVRIAGEVERDYGDDLPGIRNAEG